MSTSKVTDNVEKVTDVKEVKESDNVLQRAKDAGLKVTDGVISLPGTMKKTPKAEAKAKATKETKKETAKVEPKLPKITSKIVSSGDVLGRVIEGLTLIHRTLPCIGSECQYKISTYKNELRVAFNGFSGAELIGKMDEETAQKLNEVGFTSPDKKDFLAMVIA